MARATPCPGLVATLACCLALAACGMRQHLPLQASVTPEDCPALYVAAPGNYIIDIAEGSAVLLDPGVREFPLFCAPDTAARALEAELAAGRLPEGDWRIYRVEGGFADLAQEAEPGGPSPYALARKARLADWVDGNEKGEVK